jgi:hypothetical protein
VGFGGDGAPAGGLVCYYVVFVVFDAVELVDCFAEAATGPAERNWFCLGLSDWYCAWDGGLCRQRGGGCWAAD